MKKILSLILAVALSSIMLAGCGSKSPAKKPAENDNGPVEIEFWHSISGQLATTLNQMTENFNNTIGKEKNIKVTTVYQDWPGTDKLVTVMQAGDIEHHPDVIQIYGENMNIVRDYDRMVWVEDYINKETSSLKKSDLVPNAAEAFSIDGKMLGAPLTLSTLLMYYNKDMFDAEGISQPPATISEMADDMKKLVKKSGNKVDVYGLNSRPDSYELNSWIAAQNGVSYFGNNESGRKAPMTEVTLGKDGTLKSFLTEWNKVIDTGALKYQVDNMNEEFANQQHAMVIMSSARINIIKQLAGDKFNWGVADLPRVNADDKGGASVSGGGLFMINKDDPRKLEATWEFVQYCLSPETQMFWCKNTGYVPVNNRTYDIPEMKTFLDESPELQVAISQIKNSDPKIQEPYYPNSGAIKTAVKETIILLAKGELTSEQAEKEIIDRCTAAIKDYYRSNPLD